MPPLPLCLLYMAWLYNAAHKILYFCTTDGQPKGPFACNHCGKTYSTWHIETRSLSKWPLVSLTISLSRFLPNSDRGIKGAVYKNEQSTLDFIL